MEVNITTASRCCLPNIWDFHQNDPIMSKIFGEAAKKQEQGVSTGVDPFPWLKTIWPDGYGPI